METPTKIKQEATEFNGRILPTAELLARECTTSVTPEDAEAVSGPTTPKEIATESGHWYERDGTPFYTVPRKSDGKGGKKGEPRAVSLRFDRKIMLEKGVVPSVTTVTRILDKPAITSYRLRKLFEAMVHLLVPLWHEGQSPDFNVDSEREEFFKKVSNEAEEHRRTAAERGTSLHRAIELFLQGKSDLKSPWMPHVFDTVNAIAQYGIKLRGDGEQVERSFAHELGFGGKVDWHSRREPIVMDFKSKEEITDDQLAGKDKLVYDEHAMQIAAYSNGLGMPDARGINVFVGEKDRRVFIYEHRPSDLKRGWKLFQAILEAWKIKNNYYVHP